MAKVSFENDIMPTFSQYQAQMRWRLDLTSYEDVRENYDIIANQIDNNEMPPPEFGSLPQKVIDDFKQWKEDGFPP